MRSLSHSCLPCCWECEEPTDAPKTVTPRTARRGVATLALCARCYRTGYLPLVPAGGRPDGTLLIEPDHTDSETV